MRNIRVRQGDKVKILRGNSRKKDGKVERVDLKRERVTITGIESIKKDGTKAPVTFTPSSLMIIELNLSDKKRKKKLEGNKKENPKEVGGTNEKSS